MYKVSMWYKPIISDWCIYPPEYEGSRIGCGYNGITEQQCIDAGCCFAATANHGVPWCFKKTGKMRLA